jgi:ferredoxin
MFFRLAFIMSAVRLCAIEPGFLTICPAVLKEIKVMGVGQEKCRGSVSRETVPRMQNPVGRLGLCRSYAMRFSMVLAAFAWEVGIAELSEPAGASEKEILDAIDNCPVNCIHWQ